jgi:hypothetical protein
MLSFFIVTLFSCVRKDRNGGSAGTPNQIAIDSAAANLERSVIISPNLDTEKISFESSSQRFKIYYYRNKAQYLNIDNSAIGAGSLDHFVWFNKGIYVSLDTIIDIPVAFGVKYLNGHTLPIFS